MTKNYKQIIIDGVDVKECKIFCNTFGNSLCNPTDDIREAMNCNEYPNCLYKQLKRKEQECKNNKIAYQMELDIYNQECLNLQEELKAKEQECEELKKKIKSYQCNEKKANRCTCAFRCFENAFCNDAENKIDEIQTKIKVLKIENEILSNKLEHEENWHKSADKISKTNSEYTVKLKQTLENIAKGNIGKYSCAEEYASEKLKEISNG